MSNTDLETVINKAFDEKDMVNAQTTGEIRDAVTEALARLDAGQARVAEPVGNHQWQVNQWLKKAVLLSCLLYTSPSPRDVEESRMPSSA